MYFFFNIYVINLKRDIKKWRQIDKHFKNINIDLIRFNAVDGKHLSTHNRWSYDHPTSQWCNYLCTDGMIGCGLSHIRLADYIINNDKNSFAVVLEDDVKPTITNFREMVIETVRETPANWDIIKLNYHGACQNPNNPFLLCGSTSGYIISRTGLYKLSNLRLKYHIDWQIQIDKNINIYLSKKRLLNEDTRNSTIAETNFVAGIDKVIKIRGLNPLSWYLNQPVCRIPFLDYNVSFIKLFLIIATIVYILYEKKGLFILMVVLLFYIFLYILNRKMN